MATVINGDPSGFSTLTGAGLGADIVNLFALQNTFFAGGGSDTINLYGSGYDTVYLGAATGINDQIYLNGGSDDAVLSAAPIVDGYVAISGGASQNLVAIDNSGGTNVITFAGFANAVSVNGDATNVITLGAGYGVAAVGASGTGSGSGSGYASTVVVSGTNNRVSGGDENFTITGGGGTLAVSIGNGVNAVSTGGYDNSIYTGTNSNTIVFSGGGADRVTLGAGAATNSTVANTIALAGTGNIVTGGDESTAISGGLGGDVYRLGAGNDSIVDNGNGNVFAVGGGGTVGSVQITAYGANNQITVGGAAQLQLGLAGAPSGDTITLDATTLTSTVNLNGTGNMVFLAHGAAGVINDNASAGGLDLVVGASVGNPDLVVNGFQADPTGILTVDHSLYTSPGAVQAALRMTSAGLVLPVNGGQILFAGDHAMPALTHLSIT